MYPITFKKDRAAYFLDCLLNGGPMLHDPEQAGWTIDEMLQLAGACLFAVAAYGPIREATAAQLQDWEHEHPEHQEAEIDTMMHDLHAAMEFMAQLTQMAYDGGYDREYEPVVRCGIQAVDTRIETSVIPVEGFKGP
jgi:hypothetical protein